MDRVLQLAAHFDVVMGLTIPLVAEPMEAQPVVDRASLYSTCSHEFWISGLKVLCSRTAFFAPVPDGPARRGVPWMSCMLDDLRLHQKFIAILLLLPPVVLAALAASRDPLHATEGVRAGRVNTPSIWRR
jgi:hypothetical protein